MRRVERLSPRMTRVTFGGDELAGLAIDQPAASVRVLLPSPGATELVTPQWTGNEFLLPDGRRPTLRTFTPRRLDADALELDIDIVVHGGGAASQWADGASAGAPAAISGPARGYAIDPDAPGFLLAGDETAMPAISQLIEGLPSGAGVEVHIEVADAAGRLPLPDHPLLVAEWHEASGGASPGDALVAAVRNAPLHDDVRVWVAGEAASVQRVRRYLFEEKGVPRSRAAVRGYWKHGRTADVGADATDA